MKMTNRMGKVCVALSAALVLALNMSVSAHTPEETNEVVRTLLRRCNCLTDNLEDLPKWTLDTSNSYVFFNKINVGGDWTAEGKRAAFNTFLEAMGSFDFNGKERKYAGTAFLAVGQCQRMDYTNALPAIKRLALNPTFPSKPSWRLDAIDMVIEQLGPSEEGLQFVETILTNKTVFTLSERGCASGVYIKQLLKSVRTEAMSSVVTNAVATFWRYGKTDAAGAVMFDKLFVSEIPGYQYSSNRLDYATFMVEHPDNNRLIRNYYHGVTNQLLSTEQPLRRLTIDMGGNE